jgi:hypothetical protein
MASAFSGRLGRRVVPVAAMLLLAVAAAGAVAFGQRLGGG